MGKLSSDEQVLTATGPRTDVDDITSYTYDAMDNQVKEDVQDPDGC